MRPASLQRGSFPPYLPLLRLALVAAFICATGPTGFAEAQGIEGEPFRHDARSRPIGGWLVRARPGERHEARDAIVRAGATVLEYQRVSGLYEVAAPATSIGAIREDESVAYVEPDRRWSIGATPNDPSYDQLWAMPRISGPEAWDVTTGSDELVVAILDTGVDYNHPDLANNMWTNPGEIPGNGIDDDGNGWMDDIHGVDCISDDSIPLDGHGHGTHVAGTIGAVGNNGIGVAGVSWDVQIMALRFLDSAGNGSTSDAVECLDYAIQMGAALVNDSWGGPTESTALREAFDRSEDAGQLQVVAAGNESKDIDRFVSYPAMFANPNIISVTASSTLDSLATYSNHGDQNVDLAAPGNGIVSTVPSFVHASGYLSLSGTSMAAPHVSGAAALLWSLRPQMSVDTLRGYVLSGVDPVTALAGKLATAGRLNVARAIGQMAEPTLTSVAERPRVRALLDGDRVPVRLSWSGADADGVAGYDLEVSMDGSPFAPSGLAVPTATSKDMLLRTDRVYTYRVRARDPFSNVSDWAIAQPIRALIREESWSRIRYSGRWSRVASAAAHGKAMTMASRAGAAASMTLPARTRTLGIVAMVGPKEGRAQVWIDGVRVTTLDLYRLSFEAKTIVWAEHVAPGVHVVELRVLGRKNPLSGSARVRFDAVVLTASDS